MKENQCVEWKESWRDSADMSPFSSMPLSDESPIAVGTCSFTELLNDVPAPLAIDTYQRGFVWGEDKISQLIEDLKAAFKKDQENPSDYYMGTLLLHERETDARPRYFIIDGQQRLTALGILHHSLKETLPAKLELRYRTVESVKNIRTARACFDKDKGNLTAAIFDRLRFTVIRVAREDLAFTFFDTQNSRGVPLDATDLLKAYHLREIKCPDEEALKADCARRWESMQMKPAILPGHQDFAPQLFHSFLWRARNWQGNNIGPESRDAMLETFQKKTRPASGATVPLYRAQRNVRGAELTLDTDGRMNLTMQPVELSPNPADLPFAMRQPITAGIGFFLYADKYAALLQELMSADHPDPQVRAFRVFHDAVIAGLSVYLREAFLLCVLMFVDQFGTSALLEFALRLDHELGGIRIERGSVYGNTVKKYFRERRLNLLDVIAGAFTPQEVFDYLKQGTIQTKDESVEKQYKTASVAAIKDIQGVQWRYMAAVLAYYGKDEADLCTKPDWIDTWIKDHIAAKITEAQA